MNGGPSSARCCAAERQRNAGRDRGSLSIVMMFLLAIALAGAALIVDGGRALTARRHAANTAEAAARFAVADQAIGGDGFDAAVAAQLALAHAQRSGVAAEDVSVDVRTNLAGGTEVVVTITERRTAVFLVLGGLDEMTVSATGAATFAYVI